MPFEVIEFSDKKKWDKLLKGRADIYYQHGYAASFQSVEEGAPQLWMLDMDGARVFEVVVIRDIAKTPAMVGSLQQGELFDASTPYGYGGPLTAHVDGKEYPSRAEGLMGAYTRLVEEHCRQKNILCEFIRFHPLCQNNLLCHPFFPVRYSRKTVAISLQGKDLWTEEITTERRRNIRKAIRNNILVQIDPEAQNIAGFYAIYVKTMQRNNADDYYYFSFQFFLDTLLTLKKNALLVAAFYEDKLISGAIFLIGTDAIHCHISATDPDYLHLNASSLVLYKAAEWGRDKKLRLLHLGGGHSEDSEDQLLRFKKSFSKDGFKDFYTGQKIFNPKLYGEAVSLAAKNKNSLDRDYFPLYRSR